MGQIHKDRRYVLAAQRIRGLANGTPTAICWRCGRTLNQHPPHRNGKPPRWTAGHTIDGSTTWQPWHHVSRTPTPGDWLAPEASTCNSTAGAAHGNQQRRPTSGWQTRS